jgi:hypothetical protein
VRLFNRFARAACTLLMVCMGAVVIAVRLDIAFGRVDDGTLDFGIYSIGEGQITPPAVKIWSKTRSRPSGPTEIANWLPPSGSI